MLEKRPLNIFYFRAVSCDWKPVEKRLDWELAKNWAQERTESLQLMYSLGWDGELEESFVLQDAFMHELGGGGGGGGTPAAHRRQHPYQRIDTPLDATAGTTTTTTTAALNLYTTNAYSHTSRQSKRRGGGGGDGGAPTIDTDTTVGSLTPNLSPNLGSPTSSPSRHSRRVLAGTQSCQLVKSSTKARRGYLAAT